MKTCPTCGSSYDGVIERCPLDRAALVEGGDPLVGRVVRGAYRVLAPIGAGGLAVVYRARHEASGREVALKVLRPSHARSPVLRERFLREARAANRVKHPNVIDIADCGESDDGVVFLAMELVDGESLAALAARGPLPPTEAAAIVATLAGALAFAHEIGVVHRDVKPANVVLSTIEGGGVRPKLVDFGLAAVRGEPGLTSTGELLGTPAYMAPEQVGGRAVTPAVDVDALGCVLTELVTGAPPFTGATPSVLDAHLGAPPPSLASRRAEVDPRLDALAARMLDKRPDARPTAAVIARELAAVAGLEAPRFAPSERMLDGLAAVRALLEEVARARTDRAEATARTAPGAADGAARERARAAAELELVHALYALADVAPWPLAELEAWRRDR